jgi:hypothetical protein
MATEGQCKGQTNDIEARSLEDGGGNKLWDEIVHKEELPELIKSVIEIHQAHGCAWVTSFIQGLYKVLFLLRLQWNVHFSMLYVASGVPSTPIDLRTLGLSGYRPDSYHIQQCKLGSLMTISGDEHSRRNLGHTNSIHVRVVKFTGAD